MPPQRRSCFYFWSCFELEGAHGYAGAMRRRDVIISLVFVAIVVALALVVGNLPGDQQPRSDYSMRRGMAG